MRKIFTVITVITCLSSAIGQEYTIKKDVIIIDNEEVVSIKKQKKQKFSYDINTPSGEPLYTASIKNITPKGREISFKWIELVNKDNKIYEVDLQLKGLNFDMRKRLVENLIEKEIISRSGVDEYKYNMSKTYITDQLDSILDTVESEYLIEDKKAEEDRLRLEKSSDDFMPITSDFVLIGYMTAKNKRDMNKGGEPVIEYLVYDETKKAIAELYFNYVDTGNVLKPVYVKTLIDNKKHPIITKAETVFVYSDPMAIRMVKLLFAKGYLKSAEEAAKK